MDEAAREDLIGIWVYIANDNPQAAERVLDRIWDGLRVIAKSPRGGTARPELALELRCYSVESYVIFFRPTRDGVQIARVLHGARDVDAIIGES